MRKVELMPTRECEAGYGPATREVRLFTPNKPGQFTFPAGFFFFFSAQSFNNTK